MSGDAVSMDLRRYLESKYSLIPKEEDERIILTMTDLMAAGTDRTQPLKTYFDRVMKFVFRQFGFTEVAIGLKEKDKDVWRYEAVFGFRKEVEAHVKLRPVDFATDGIFLCGLAHSPRLIGESVSQALAAAARANTVLSKESIEAEGAVSIVDERKCTGCGTCVEICPYGAIRKNEGGIAEVVAAMCKGCGGCGATCPESAITVMNYTDEQLLAQAKASLEDTL